MFSTIRKIIVDRDSLKRIYALPVGQTSRWKLLTLHLESKSQNISLYEHKLTMVHHLASSYQSILVYHILNLCDMTPESRNIEV
jgi:hypothetical protein